MTGMEANPTSVQQLEHLRAYACTKDGQSLVAKIISRDQIGASGKRKQYAKWNAQVKHLTELNNPHLIRTLEVIRNKQQYILIQERNSETTMSLAEYIARQAEGKPPKSATKLIGPRQLQQIIVQLVAAFEDFSVK